MSGNTLLAAAAPARLTLSGYDPGGPFCELLDADNGPIAGAIRDRLASLDPGGFAARSLALDRLLFESGVTFTVYSEKDLIDRVLPLDPIPRLISARDWAFLEKGLVQRVTALNLFVADIYGPRRAIADGIVPEDLVLSNPALVPAMVGVKVPLNTWIHIAGIDLVRDRDGRFKVLEDNCRTPSGVSYVVQNRQFLLREFPDLFVGLPIRPVSQYGARLVEALAETAPTGVQDPTVVLLSPGIFNSAYFEHIFLASEMGVPLVEGRDLFVDDRDQIFMRTVRGPRPVHVIYRRIDDAFLDPEAFRPDSMLGVAGLFRAVTAGRVTLANAIGTGVCDDKALYAYVPRLIQYYLSEEPILDNVRTWICREPESLAFVRDHIADLVLKPVGGSGGYGICIGPLASAVEREAARQQLLAEPQNWVAQPMIDLSVSPTLVGEAIEPRRVDLRPFIVTGRKPWVLPGGLTRVALRRGSIIVNSSQGGGTKDTWVLAGDSLDPEAGGSPRP